MVQHALPFFERSTPPPSTLVSRDIIDQLLEIREYPPQELAEWLEAASITTAREFYGELRAAPASVAGAGEDASTKRELLRSMEGELRDFLRALASRFARDTRYIDLEIEWNRERVAGQELLRKMLGRGQ